MVETGDSVRDGAGESVGVSEGAVGELMLLEIAPASFWTCFGKVESSRMSYEELDDTAATVYEGI